MDSWTMLRVIVSVAMAVCTEARPQSSNPQEVIFSSFHNGTEKQHTNDTDIARERTRILVRAPNNHRGVVGTTDEDQDIIFPDSLETSEESASLDGPPRCAGEATFCEEIDSYPYAQLRDVLRRTKVRKDLFGLDETPDEIANRIGEPEVNFVCPSDDTVIFPKVGKTKHNEWKYIINQGDSDGYVQGVRVETCKGLNRPCQIIGNLPDGVATSCKQKYVYRRMLSLSQQGQAAVETFLMPSACCCSYTRDLQFLRRFGQRVTPVKR